MQRGGGRGSTKVGVSCGGLGPPKTEPDPLPPRGATPAHADLTPTPAGPRLPQHKRFAGSPPPPLTGGTGPSGKGLSGLTPRTLCASQRLSVLGTVPGGWGGLCSPTAKAFRKPTPSQTQKTRTGPTDPSLALREAGLRAACRWHCPPPLQRGCLSQGQGRLGLGHRGRPGTGGGGGRPGVLVTTGLSGREAGQRTS